MSLTGSVTLQEGWFIIISKWKCFIRLVWKEYLSLWIFCDEEMIMNIRVVLQKELWNSTREITMGGRNICLTILHSMVKGEPGIFPLLSENPWSVSVAHSPLYNWQDIWSLILQLLVRPLLGRIWLFIFQFGPSSISDKLLWDETCSRFLLACNWWQLESCQKKNPQCTYSHFREFFSFLFNITK